MRMKIALFAITALFAAFFYPAVARAQPQWVAINDGLSNLDVSALGVDAQGNLYAGTLGGGVFRKLAQVDSWTAINNGLTDAYITELVVAGEGHLFAITSPTFPVPLGSGFFIQPTAETFGCLARRDTTLSRSPHWGFVQRANCFCPFILKRPTIDFCSFIRTIRATVGHP